MTSRGRQIEEAMTNREDHICVCICTYKRADYLRRLLNDLRHQETGGRFTYSIVVCDNDLARSAEVIVSEFAETSTIAIKYCVEGQQNISLARNKSIAGASGNFIAFIDDDEFPDKCWLLNLFDTLNEYQVDGVLGPVKRYFDTTPPKWLLKSNFYARVIHPTGTVLDRDKGRTGNVLLKREMFDGQDQPFNRVLLGGGDKEFFRRMINEGYRFIWTAEAVVYEVVPPNRWKRSFLLKRAFFRGANVPLHPGFGWRYVVRSMVAVPTYILVLPITLFLGQHWFMTILVKLCDHLGLLLAIVGIKPLHQAYITD
jgi:glycosyltransferase involved in cell wall biosynthesis